MQELYEDDYIYDKKLLLGSTKVSPTFIYSFFSLEQHEVLAAITPRTLSDRLFESSFDYRPNENQINASTQEIQYFADKEH